MVFFGSAVAGTTVLPAYAQNAADAPKVEEVIVTAERRAQNLSDIPLSATVLNTDELQERGVTDAHGLQNVAPSLVINTYLNSSFVNIRGIGLAVSAPTVVQGVPFYMNGAYVAYDATLNGSFFDIASVEVLRGPQGTLTGLNSTGGAIYLRSAPPKLGVSSGYAQTTISDYNGLRIEGGGTLPLGEKMALRLAGMKNEQDSFTRNLGTGGQPGDTNEYAVRGDFLYRPIDELTVNLRSEYYDSDNQYLAIKRRDDTNPNPFQINEDGISQGETGNVRSDLEVNWQATDGVKLRYQAARGVGHQFGLGDRNHDVGGAANNLGILRYDARSWTHEFDVISTGDGPFQWVVGAFYLDQSTGVFIYRFVDQYARPSVGDQLRIWADQDVTSKAVFGQGTYKFSDQWELSVGARYSRDWQRYERLPGAVASAPPDLGATTASESTPTGKVALNYRPNDNNLIYASVSRGYKPGGNNPIIALGSFKGERNLVEEIGWKTSLFDKAISVNTAVFHSKLEDGQFSGLFVNANGTTSPRTANAAPIVSKGAEFEVFGKVRDLGLSFGLSYLDATFNEAGYLVNSDPTLPATAAALQLVPAGRTAPFAPKWTTNASVHYDIHLGDKLLTPRLSYSYVDDQYATPFPNGPTPAQRNSLVPSHGLLDARLSYQHTESLSGELFVTNLTDETYIASQMQTNTAFNGGYIYGAPRVFGARLKYSFGE